MNKENTTDPAIVETGNGLVRGESGDGVYVWRGIPFAASTEGALRFDKPQPAVPWAGVRDALEFGPMSPQTRKMEGRASVGVMSEDCLTLNIWSPAADGGKRPVLFYIHGGSFVEGAGSDPEYEGSNLAREGDVVVVTVNYRLGALGYMDFSFLGEGFEANCGLWDILAALRWVSENIGAFGGDAGNVTVCGQSAGASCACILSTASAAQGYIKQIIMMSGAPLLLHTKEKAQKIARRFMEFAGLPDADSLRAAPADALAGMQKEFSNYTGLGASTFAPSVDGDFISGFPICAAQDGKIGGIPILIGVTRDEMSVVLFKSLSKLLDISEVRDVGKQAESEETTRLIMDAYRANRRRAPADMMTDAVFHLPCTWFAGAYSKNAGTWMYRFDYATLSMRIFGLRAFHSSDIPFLFGNFRAGLARYMLLLSPWKGRIGRVHRELQGDFLTFMRKGALPWVKCKGENIHAKYYALPLSEGPVVRAEVKQAYDGSEVRRKSLAGEDIVSCR